MYQNDNYFLIKRIKFELLLIQPSYFFFDNNDLYQY